jgi:hypothetical protein
VYERCSRRSDASDAGVTEAGRDARASAGASAIDVPAVRAILEGAIDYAGLFPPAGFTMPEAVREYADVLRGENAWALGRFVVSAARLEEFAREHEAWREASSPNGIDWPVSVIVGDAEQDVARLNALRSRADQGWRVESVEAKATSAAQIRALARVLPDTLERYIEVPIDHQLLECVAAIRAIGAAAKVRTGGTTADAFPRPVELLRFMRACHEASVPFKATAGLHHAMRGEYPMTYERESVSTTMFGYLNLILAAALLLGGATDDILLDMLTERGETALQFGGARIAWRGRAIPLDLVVRARRGFIRGIGSCSFREPLEGLSGLVVS